MDKIAELHDSINNIDKQIVRLVWAFLSEMMNLIKPISRSCRIWE